jgi:hypothetical protein
MADVRRGAEEAPYQRIVGCITSFAGTVENLKNNNPPLFLGMAVDFKLCSLETRKDIRDRLMGLVMILEGKRWSSKGVTDAAGEDLKGTRAACSNRGGPSSHRTVVLRERQSSTKCGCPAAFTITHIGIIRWTAGGRHSAACLAGGTDAIPADAADVRVDVAAGGAAAMGASAVGDDRAPATPKKRAYELSKMMSPTDIAAETANAVEMLSNDGSLTTRNLTLQLVGRGVGRPLAKRIVNAAKKQAAGGVVHDAEQSLALLLRELGDGDRFVYSVLSSELDPTAICAVIFTDKTLLPKDGAVPCVLTSDATHAITASDSGFPKISTFAAIGGDLKVNLISTTALQKEDAFTFKAEARHVKRMYPSLGTDVFVLLVDGDAAKIAAARAVFSNVVIILCLYHSSENAKAHLRPLMRSQHRLGVITSSSGGVTGAAAAADDGEVDEEVTVEGDDVEDEDVKNYFIQCIECSKWRTLEHEAFCGASPPINFCCSDAPSGWTCDTPQDELVMSFLSGEDSTTMRQVMSVCLPVLSLRATILESTC